MRVDWTGSPRHALLRVDLPAPQGPNTAVKVSGASFSSIRLRVGGEPSGTPRHRKLAPLAPWPWPLPLPLPLPLLLWVLWPWPLPVDPFG